MQTLLKLYYFKSEIMGKLENVQYTEDMAISSIDVSHLIEMR